jgi:hypothetical protein
MFEHTFTLKEQVYGGRAKPQKRTDEQWKDIPYEIEKVYGNFSKRTCAKQKQKEKEKIPKKFLSDKRTCVSLLLEGKELGKGCRGRRLMKFLS